MLIIVILLIVLKVNFHKLHCFLLLSNLFKMLNKVALISNVLPFFLFLVDKFTLLDPGGKMNADPCGSGSVSTALVSTVAFA